MTSPSTKKKFIQSIWNKSVQEWFSNWSFLVATVLSIAYTLWMGSPSDGPNTASISKSFDTVLTPAGFAFSIWGLIYFILIVIGILIGLGRVKLNSRGNIFYLLSCIWICLWSIFWTALDPVLSGLALTMIMGFNVATFGELVESNQELLLTKPRFYHLVTSGFLVYVGWTIVAAVINITIALKYGFGFSGLGISEDIWRWIVISFAIIINILFSKRVRNWTTLGVLAWALFGIWVKSR
ncbi:MAG: hypothetical protein H7230_04385 [Candidatus Parcubacteria bacterium]|nr:hypothetical protein [Candidatus Paceibacterota bacterium]